MNLKPLLFLAGAVGAAAVVVKRRGGGEQISQAASSAAARVSDAAPQQVKDAAQQAGATVQRAVENAPEPVRSAVETVTSAAGGGEDEQTQQRFEPPIEGLAQPPSEPGGAPSDDVPLTSAPRIASEPGEQLNTPTHAPPEGAVMPDTSTDPLVDSQTRAAMGDAGSIGGNVDEMAAEDAGFPADPEMRPVVEGAGDENQETFEAREGQERSHRETET